jgi:hypothetical protein
MGNSESAGSGQGRTPLADDLVLGINRPEFFSNPESLVFGLVEGAYGTTWPIDDGDKYSGATFKKASSKPARMTLHVTEPYEDVEKGRRWEEALNEGGIDFRGVAANRAGMAFAAAITGTKPVRATGQAAVPLTTSLANLQDLRGVFVKSGPANVHQIIERMYLLGSRDEEPASTAVGLWLSAVERRLGRDPILRAIDDAVVSALLPRRPEAKNVPPPAPRGPWLGKKTPFAWFHDVWNRLTATDWVDSLPERRWIDWATTVLRTATGLGHTWEVRWYQTIAKAVVKGPEVAQGMDWKKLLDQTNQEPLVRWEHSSRPPGHAAIGSELRAALLTHSDLVRALEDHLDSRNNEGESVTDALVRLAEDGAAQKAFGDALGGRRQGKPNANTDYAVRYTLQEREGASENELDLYGFLAGSGQWHRVDPSPEWIAVMASLSMPGPREESTTSAVEDDLRRLGLRPPLEELVKRLERAGLAASSPDADEAVRVRCAY